MCFLFGHLSWRGYWQELIESIVWAHEHTRIANLVYWKDKPVALSIVQARLVGLAHFSIGYVLTYGLNGLGHPSYCWAACRK